MKKYIPNFITSLNVASGVISIILAFEGYLEYAGYFILLAAVFDFLDGMFARLLKAYSELGKQLDSLADLVSFGVAPAAIMYNLLKSILLIEDLNLEEIGIEKILILLSPALITIFSAIRLAKFNIDTRQTTSFIGLPTPANAIFYASLPIILANTMDFKIYFVVLNLYVLIPVIVIFSLLLVSELKMFSLKFKNFDIKENLVRYIFLAIAVLFIVFLKLNSIPVIILVYILVSGISSVFVKPLTSIGNEK